MSDGGLTTVQSGPFTVTTTSGISNEDLTASLKGPDDKAASEAASRLGKRGGKASAEARAEGEAEPEKPTVTDGVDQSTQRQIKPIPPKVEAKAEPEGGPAPKEEAKPEPETGAEPPEAKPEEPKDKRGDPRHDPRARMLEATRQAAEAKRQLAEQQRRNDELAARLEALERGERPQPRTAQEPKKGEGRPALEDFLAQHDTYEKGLEAYIEARDAHRDREAQQRAQEAAFERWLDEGHKSFAEALGAAGVKREMVAPEVGELKTSFQLFKIDPEAVPSGENWVADYLFTNPKHAPPLVLHLSAHPEDIQRIAALSSLYEVTREMAILVTRLEAATTGDGSKREAAVSTAAPPVKPVTGKSYVSDGEWRPGMSVDEYRKIWEKQTGQR